MNDPRTAEALSLLLAELVAARERCGLDALGFELAGYPDGEQIIQSPRIPDDAKAYLLILGEWQALFTAIYLVTFLAKTTSNRKWVNACTSLSYRLATGLKAIADVCVSGLEVQAFQLARMVAEDAQMLTLCLISDEWCKTFTSGNTVEAANLIWHSKLSRGRLRAAIVTELRDRGVLLEELASMTEWRKEEERTFGLFVHPTYISGLVHAFVESDGGVGTLPWFREKPASVGTRPFTFLTSTLTELASGLRLSQTRLRATANGSSIPEAMQPLCKYLRAVRRWTPMLVTIAPRADRLAELIAA